MHPLHWFIFKYWKWRDVIIKKVGNRQYCNNDNTNNNTNNNTKNNDNNTNNTNNMRMISIYKYSGLKYACLTSAYTPDPRHSVKYMI